MFVEPFSAQAGFDFLILLDLYLLGEFREWSVVLVAWEGCCPLAVERVHECIVHYREHVQADGYEYVCFGQGESVPDVAVAPDLDIVSVGVFLVNL